MNVIFQRHTGIHLATKQTIDLGQSRIFVDGRHVGYVGDQPAAPVCLVHQEPPAVHAAIRDELAKLRGVAPKSINEPPPPEAVEADAYEDLDE